MDEHLLEALAGIDRPGDVFAAGDRAPVMPGLEVEGLGTVGLPLPKAQARALIRRCRQAPYGKGTQTLVDTDVRRVWEMDPAHFELINPKWEALIESILMEVRQRLGLEECKLSAHLYKLLLYENGSFFLPHRDGERLDAMVATLIVALPAVHEGGELVIRHEGREHEIAFPGAASGLELSYAAFYADCPHEVRPLRGGYRLCLVYNVTLARPHRRKQLRAPSYGAVTAKVAALLGAWRREAGETEKRMVTLEHGYTRDGLTPDKLKGTDRARAEVLFEAAEQAGCIAHLALITLWQLGSVDHDYSDYSYRRRRRYGSRYGDDHDEDSGPEREMGEIIDTSLRADHWSDRHGNARQFGEMRVDEDEVVAGDALDDAEPSEEEFEDYTGNAGLTLERWYHRAAIAVWPRERHFAVLCGAGTQAAIGGLEALVKELGQGSGEQREATRRDGLQFAGAIIDGWNPRSPMWFGGGGNDAKADRSLFSKLLCKLDDPGLMRRFLCEIVPHDGSAELHGELAKLCRRHGLSGFEAALARAIDAASEATLLRNAQLLHLLCRQPALDEGDAAVCTRLCAKAVVALERFDGQAPKDTWRPVKLDRTALLVTLVSAMLEIGAQHPLRKLIDHTLAHREHYGLTDAHLAAIFELEPRLEALSPPGKAVAHWLSTCRRELQGRTARAPQAPTDYRRDAELSCNCEDCRVLGRFLADPNERECRLPLNQARRGHLHGIIEAGQCDVTHVTERKGRPFKLVCTKTTASYERACKAFERDKRNLSRIVRIEEGLG